MTSALFADLANLSPPNSAFEEAAQDLHAQVANGTLSIYRCDTQDELELVAIARSIKCKEEASFRFLEIADGDIAAANLPSPTPSPGKGTLSITEANALHFTLSLADQPATERLVRSVHAKFVAFLQANGLNEADPTASISKSDLKRLVQAKSGLRQHVPNGHWLLRVPGKRQGQP